MSTKSLKTYKRINKEADIFGFPFMIFFALLLFTILSFLIVYSVGLFIAVIWICIYIGIIGVFWFTYKKYGLKQTLKNIELYFRNPEVIKVNGTIKIKKLDFDL